MDNSLFAGLAAIGNPGARFNEAAELFAILKTRYPDTRAAAKSDEGIKRAQDAMDPPKRGR